MSRVPEPNQSIPGPDLRSRSLQKVSAWLTLEPGSSLSQSQQSHGGDEIVTTTLQAAGRVLRGTDGSTTAWVGHKGLLSKRVRDGRFNPDLSTDRRALHYPG